MNSVQLVGRLARDPEYGTTQSGISYCRFTVACQRRFANAQGVREADFINCQAWRQTADFVQRYFSKGSAIGLNGSIQVRSYDGQDGQKHWSTEVLVDNVEFVGSKGGDQQNTQNRAAPAASAPRQQQPQQTRMTYGATTPDGFTEVEDDDELPF